jgi:hypothetical protein
MARHLQIQQVISTMIASTICFTTSILALRVFYDIPYLDINHGNKIRGSDIALPLF